MPELLAPAGNLACALAAFDSGADAVYCGLKKFNARERTENFSFDEMSKLISYAKKYGKRVYVTFNTLVKENELEEAASFLAQLDSLRPDALIVQDLGVVALARKYFPRLVLHGSTQMGLHNSYSLRFAAGIGLKRVIMERQTTLTELKEMLKNDPPVEVEMFIHGALCCCISGSCFLSSWLGGWSGNRGKCKQPCRRRYRSSQGNGFFLSAQDLCMLERIPELLSMPIASFKIEGRLRRPDYVENVVSSYRLAMDAAMEDPSGERFREILPRARMILSKTCGRKWSEGYYLPSSAKTLVKFDALGVSGLLAGKVLSCGSGGFAVKAFRPLALGDMLRIQPKSGDDGPSLEITKMLSQGRSVSFLPRNGEGFIFADKAIPPDGLVYKTSGKCRGDYASRIAVLKKEGCFADLTLSISRSSCQVDAELPGGKLTWKKVLSLAEAAKQPLSEERVKKEFSSWDLEKVRPGAVSVRISENPFLPASLLKSLRKEFCLFLSRHLPGEDLAEREKKLFDEKFRNDYASLVPYEGPFLGSTFLLPRRKKFVLPPFRLNGETHTARLPQDDPSPREEFFFPFYVNESALPALEEPFLRFLKKGGFQVRASSPYVFPFVEECVRKFREKGGKTEHSIVFGTAAPLHVCNSFAASLLSSLGAEKVQASPELGKSEIEALCRKSPLPVECYVFGRPVLLGTRAFLPVEGKMEDGKGETFLVEKEGILTLILPEKIMETAVCKGASGAFFDCRNADPREKGNARFNFDVGLA